MANWYGAARTNYFPVFDAEAFKAWAAGVFLRPFQSTQTGLWAVCCEDQYGGWPSFIWSEESDDDPEEFDMVAELAAHVPEGCTVVLMGPAPRSSVHRSRDGLPLGKRRDRPVASDIHALPSSVGASRDRLCL